MNNMISPQPDRILVNMHPFKEEITMTRHTKDRMRKRRIGYEEIQVTLKYGTQYINRNGKPAYEYGGLMVVTADDGKVITIFYVDGESWVGLHKEVVSKCERLQEANSQLESHLQNEVKKRLAAQQKIEALRDGITQALKMDSKNQMLLSHLSLIDTNQIEEQFKVDEACLPLLTCERRPTGRWIIREAVKKCMLLEEENSRLKSDLQNQIKGRHAVEQKVQTLRYDIAHAIKKGTKNEMLPSQLPQKITNRFEAQSFDKMDLTQTPIC